MYENFLGNKTAWKILRVLSEAPGKGVSISEIKNNKSWKFCPFSSIRTIGKI